MFEHTIFINLAERVDRLEHVIQELAKIGIHDAMRLDALKDDSGAIGCTLSHISALTYAKEHQWDKVFICEDDITFTNPEKLLASVEHFSSLALTWDVLIVGGNNCPPYTLVDNWCCKITNCQTTTGYIIQSHYYDVLIENFKESVSHLQQDWSKRNQNIYALDMYWKSLQKKDQWYMLLPLTVTQYINYSNIEKKIANYDNLMLDMEKKWLFQSLSIQSRETQHQRNLQLVSQKKEKENSSRNFKKLFDI